MIREREGRLADNIARFARILRDAGLPIGPGKLLRALEAASLVSIEQRAEFRAALESTLVDRAEQRALFHQAFEVYWCDPKLMERALQLMLPKAPGRLPPRTDVADLNNRLQQAFRGPRAHARSADEDMPVELDAALSVSARELLARRDFETMTIEEATEAKRMLRELHLDLPVTLTRRSRAQASGPAIDMRKTMRLALRTGGEWIVQGRRRRRVRPAGLVVLCDISGSMTRYSRMLLHFLHAVGLQRSDFHAFTFGTRLTNITRPLRRRDVDEALKEVGRTVPDWSGGTRIGACLREFNLRWGRRVLAQGAVVILASDGLDCGDSEALAREMHRLRGSCKRVVWLNPLLRFEGFRPRASGVRAMLPYVDDFVPAHNIASLSDLGRVLSGPPASHIH